MADENDLRDLHAGDLDMVRRDLRGADLSHLDLPNRDFTGSHLEGVNFANSNLSNCIFSGAYLAGANFAQADIRNTTIQGSSIYEVNFSMADLRNSVFNQSHLTKSNLLNAKLEGASFLKSHINDGTTFKNCSIDKDTKFDGTSILRPIARQPAFQYYRIERGILVRKTDDEIQAMSPEQRSPPAEPDERGAARDRVVAHMDSLLAKLKELPPPKPPATIYGGIGHNNPPEETPLEKPEYDALRETLIETKENIVSTDPKSEIIEKCRRLCADAAIGIGGWIARHANVFTEELAKTFAKATGTAAVGVGVWAIWATVKADLHHLVDALDAFMKFLG